MLMTHDWATRYTSEASWRKPSGPNTPVDYSSLKPNDVIYIPSEVLEFTSRVTNSYSNYA